MKRSKRYRALAEKIDRNKYYAVTEAIGLIKEFAGAKFDETVEVVFKLGIDPRQSDQQLRGSYSLPKGIGKSMRVLVFAEGEKAEAAKAAGAIETGGQDLVKKVEDGFLDFDVAIAVPEMMRFVGRLGRTLGPKGLMPSPKSGTVTNDVTEAVSEFAAGKIEYRNDSSGNLHIPVGKGSFSAEDLEANVNAFYDHVRSLRPAAVKGRYIEKVVLSCTMGPGLKLDLN
ncbi:MAG: 50S ribosomal protein L1 [Planctomycetota bacterium]|jgi:large subunit ribosomal protein L1|nr:50S ribosomal protein L1 [Planctomycetota bacterium]MDP7129450.1 50S ribosomal protein L1 [Planctomycetota bacterium]MDP7250039.1 50S ribosomal protein L1 [Planctomycetota bacterium]